MTLLAEAPPTYNLDPSTPEFYHWDNRHAWEWLSSSTSLYKIEEPSHPEQDPFWCATNYDTMRTIMGDPITFTGRHGLMLGKSFVHAPGRPDDPRLKLAMRPLMIMEVEDHKRVRSAAVPRFHPKIIRDLETDIREIVRSVLDRLDTSGPVDFQQTFSRWVPLILGTTILGVSRDRAQDFHRWNRNILASYEVGGSLDWNVMLEMVDFFDAELDAIRDDPHPRPGLLSDLVANENLVKDEMIALGWNILSASHGTTECLFGNTLINLLTQPGLKDAILEDMSLMEGAVIETLRYSTVAYYGKKQATVDVELEGQQIRAGETVMFNYRVSNSNPVTYPDPFTFDPRRKQNPAVFFGFGMHHCLGSSLARIEARIAFEELLTRFPNIRLAGEPERKATTFLNFVPSIPVLLT